VVTNTDAVRVAFTPSATLTATAVPGFDAYVFDFGEFGQGITGADLNGDGYNDLIVGAPNACNPIAGVLTCDGNAPGQRLVFLFMRGPPGIDSTPSFIIRGTDGAGAEFFGWSMTTVDWNKDGVDDVAIGAPFAATGEGAVFIFLGDSGTGSRWTPGATAGVLA